MTARFVVGIDLGTSNSALAYADPSLGPKPTPVDLPIPQLRSPGEVALSTSLPSCLYLPHPDEFPTDALRLPWHPAPPATPPNTVVGELARNHGARVPGRLVASAKSWLCHPGIDRSAPTLPWGAAPDVTRISPVDASAHYLAHLAHAWNHAHPQHPLADQEIILTVPASFDAVARNLTVLAAQRAGLPRCTLVEEPQAAFHAFLHAALQRGTLESDLRGIRSVLVIDIGGGTTDFTLVQIDWSADTPSFQRVAVGDHLMLGGDNIDAALARHAETRLNAGGRRLSATQWSQLLQSCRRAKEILLRHHAPDSVPVTVAASGSALLGNTLSTSLSRTEVERIVAEGFLPHGSPNDPATPAPRTALQELGLPYAKDPAITRHLAAFLRAHRLAGWHALGSEPPPDPRQLPRPDAVLLNGGVLNAAFITQRLIDILSSWWPDHPPVPTLPHESLDLAVARGAACHALAKHGLSRRVSGGSSHAIYVGLGSSGPDRRSALCVIPRGWEQGATAELGNRTFHLTLNQPVQFPLYTSTADRFESPGDIVPLAEDLQPLPPLHTLLHGRASGTAEIPVHLIATLTEIGTLDLACVANSSPERWRLEFELRATNPAPDSHTPPPTEPLPPRFPTARADLERLFAPKPKKPPASTPADPEAAAKAARQALSLLEKHLGPRDQWSLPVLRELWSVLLDAAPRRRRSPDHERTFFQLAGFTLRPGFGYPLDDWRCEQIAPLFEAGIAAVRDPATWNAFWIHWRRIAGGLSPQRHQELWSHLRPHLGYRIDPDHPKHAARPKGVQPEGLHEMVRLAASLEHLPATDKAELGHWILLQLHQPNGPAGPWAWALGRLGARVSLARRPLPTIPPDLAAQWLHALQLAHQRGADAALFALVQIGRLTGDRARDLDASARIQALETLKQANAPAHWQTLLTEVAELDTADEARALGDSLPVGLRLA